MAEETEMEECLREENESLRRELDGIYARALHGESASVRVVIALDEDARVRECVVLTDSRQADELYSKLRGIWGGANVAMASRKIDDLPQNLETDIASITDIVQ